MAEKMVGVMVLWLAVESAVLLVEHLVGYLVRKLVVWKVVLMVVLMAVDLGSTMAALTVVWKAHSRAVLSGVLKVLLTVDYSE